MKLIGMDAIDFSARRRDFFKQMKNSVAVFVANREFSRNPDVLYPYRQESNFFYLTGFAEPNAICLMAPQSDHPFQLFVQPKDSKRELWMGKVLGPEAARKHLGADAAFSSTPDDYFDKAFIAAAQKAERVFFCLGEDADFDRRLLKLLRQAMSSIRRGNRGLLPIHDPEDILGEMRLNKSKAEVARLQTAARITAEAHTEAMRLTKPGMYEFEIEAVLHHAFRAGGAARLGYGSIVAGGENACTLHYEHNDQRLRDGDLLLIDAGAEYDYYTADITRTFPVGRSFSAPQREVYAAVLRAQKACIAAARPGATLLGLHELVIDILTEELRKMKVLKGTTAQIRKSQAWRDFYPHGTSHWLGMDVHDVGRYYGERYGVERKLAPGHVFTIEPGLYFQATSSAPARYKGIGVRIEDDILITSNGCRVLTSTVPKEIDEIEAIRGQS